MRSERVLLEESLIQTIEESHKDFMVVSCVRFNYIHSTSNVVIHTDGQGC